MTTLETVASSVVTNTLKLAHGPTPVNSALTTYLLIIVLGQTREVQVGGVLLLLNREKHSLNCSTLKGISIEFKELYK